MKLIIKKFEGWRERKRNLSNDWIYIQLIILELDCKIAQFCLMCQLMYSCYSLCGKKKVVKDSITFSQLLDVTDTITLLFMHVANNQWY